MDQKRRQMFLSPISLTEKIQRAHTTNTQERPRNMTVSSPQKSFTSKKLEIQQKSNQTALSQMNDEDKKLALEARLEDSQLTSLIPRDLMSHASMITSQKGISKESSILQNQQNQRSLGFCHLEKALNKLLARMPPSMPLEDKWHKISLWLEQYNIDIDARDTAHVCNSLMRVAKSQTSEFIQPNVPMTAVSVYVLLRVLALVKAKFPVFHECIDDVKEKIVSSMYLTPPSRSEEQEEMEKVFTTQTQRGVDCIKTVLDVYGTRKTYFQKARELARTFKSQLVLIEKENMERDKTRMCVERIVKYWQTAFQKLLFKAWQQLTKMQRTAEKELQKAADEAIAMRAQIKKLAEENGILAATLTSTKQRMQEERNKSEGAYLRRVRDLESTVRQYRKQLLDAGLQFQYSTHSSQSTKSQKEEDSGTLTKSGQDDEKPCLIVSEEGEPTPPSENIGRPITTHKKERAREEWVRILSTEESDKQSDKHTTNKGSNRDQCLSTSSLNQWSIDTSASPEDDQRLPHYVRSSLKKFQESSEVHLSDVDVVSEFAKDILSRSSSEVSSPIEQFAWIVGSLSQNSDSTSVAKEASKEEVDAALETISNTVGQTISAEDVQNDPSLYRVCLECMFQTEMNRWKTFIPETASSRKVIEHMQQCMKKMSNVLVLQPDALNMPDELLGRKTSCWTPRGFGSGYFAPGTPPRSPLIKTPLTAQGTSPPGSISPQRRGSVNPIFADEKDAVTDVLQGYQRFLEATFKYLLSRDVGKTSVNVNEFCRFMVQCQIGNIKDRAAMMKVFRTATGDAEDMGMREFILALKQSAEAKYGGVENSVNDEETVEPAVALKKFLDEHLVPHADTCDTEEFFTLMKDKEIQHILHVSRIRKLFTKYSRQNGSKRESTFEDFQLFVRQYHLIDTTFTHEACRDIFIQLQEGSPCEGIDFEGFQRLIVAIAMYKYPQPFYPVSQKLRRFLTLWLKPNKKRNSECN